MGEVEWLEVGFCTSPYYATSVLKDGWKICTTEYTCAWKMKPSLNGSPICLRHGVEPSFIIDPMVSKLGNVAEFQRSLLQCMLKILTKLESL